ncbi:ribosome silencing factor [Treponema parvum]|uniref:Ribosomal silencing factor RsfS n=1 Tax=Treponema parvum TaxID=138851 RepID=A0A975IBZ8_9SPIR|nr:ribosome silencing factor [Treponema parvum]QTQ11491.1 ribosome silencing factor [Treponema parvum]QTQ16561.1 ribosome silencing factor [Treponema parvum]
MNEIETKALEIARLLQDGKGKDVCVLDISELNSWTDYFIIATVNSSSHQQGLYKDVKDYIKDHALEIHTVHRKTPDGNDWNLIDLGPIVVHLMSEAARNFYDLEKLWFAGRKVDFKTA